MIVTTEDVYLSDQFMVIFNVESEVLKREVKTVTYRKIKSVDNEKFCSGINENFGNITATMFGEKVQCYNSVMKEPVDTHATLKTKTIKLNSEGWLMPNVSNLGRRNIRSQNYQQTKNFF